MSFRGEMPLLPGRGRAKHHVISNSPNFPEFEGTGVAHQNYSQFAHRAGGIGAADNLWSDKYYRFVKKILRDEAGGQAAPPFAQYLIDAPLPQLLH